MSELTLFYCFLGAIFTVHVVGVVLVCYFGNKTRK